MSKQDSIKNTLFENYSMSLAGHGAASITASTTPSLTETNTSQLSSESPRNSHAAKSSRQDSLPSRGEAMAKTGSRLKKLTRKATKMAADVAFGSAYSNDGVESAQLAQYRLAARAKSDVAMKELEIKKYETLFQGIRDHSMELYLEYLRFFLKYLDDSENDDVLKYASMRNDLCRSWFKKVFTQFESILKLWELPDFTESPRTTNLKSFNHLPDVSVLHKELFHDRQISLLLLWHTQIQKRILNQPLILKYLTSAMKADCEICVITTNKLKSTLPKPDEYLPKILKTHVSPAHVEFIDGWQLRHDVSNHNINYILLGDRYQQMSDLRGTGRLPEDLQQQYPHFSDVAFLTKEFLENFLTEEERHFLYGYSSFLVPNLSTIPLPSRKNALVVCSDYSRVIRNETEMIKSLKEFQRILKPGGQIFLNVMDLDPIPNAAKRVGLSKDAIDVSKEEYIRLLINHKLAQYAGPFKANMSQYILRHLKQSKDWTNVKFSKVGFPVIEGKYYGSGLKMHVHDEDKCSNGSYANKDVDIDEDDDDDPKSLNSKAAAMFDFNASFMEFTKFTNILGCLEWYEGSKKPSPEILELANLWVDWRINGLQGRLVQQLFSTRTLLDGVDRELGVRVDLMRDDVLRGVCGVDCVVSITAESTRQPTAEHMSTV